MHPAFMSWWKHAREHAREHGGFSDSPRAGWGEGRGGEGPERGPGPGFCGPGGRGGWGGGRGHGGPGPFGHESRGPGGRFGGEDGGGFGVRRPLRFLAHKLDLTEAQVPELARILDELKTERAQAEVDLRRTTAAFADAMEGATFGEEKSREGGDLRVKSAERLRDAVTTALSRIHAMLEDEQRKRFSYLIRTGIVSL